MWSKNVGLITKKAKLESMKYALLQIRDVSNAEIIVSILNEIINVRKIESTQQ